MSAETKAAVESALAAHTADEMSGKYVTGWVVFISSSNLDRGTSYQVLAPDMQPFHVSAGLANVGDRLLTRAFTENSG